ncbi:MAG: DUF1385 domain-containing protein [Clostridia bacterium]|nr:DUF1385 domain-containing protein [Clostridia bacterium]
MSKENTNEVHITSIGGQAVMEGVMMRGPYKTAVAVRKPDGEIERKVEDNGVKTRSKFWRLPVIRGCVNFVDSLVIGMKALMYSAEFVDIEGDDEEEKQSKFDKWLEDKFGDKIKDIVIYVSIGISLIFSIALFMILPTFITKGVEKLGEIVPFLSPVTNSHLFSSLLEGVVRMAIFIGYLALVSQMKDIKRVFMYHGAEHKTIACYEAGEELTVENVKKLTRFHPRCGTSFLLFVMIVSILLFALLPRTDLVVLRVVMRLALLPAVAGISYELIKWAGRSKNICVTWLSKPGLWLQKLTTREPDDSMMEVAIASMEPCIPENKEDDKW